MKKSIRQRFFAMYLTRHSYKLPFITTAVFIMYLLTLPHIVSLSVPCLRPIPGQSYEFNDCRVLYALDRYLFYALGGFSVMVLSLFFFSKNRRIKPILGTAALLSILIIILFHVYIPQAEKQVRSAPVILDINR